jgi:hypothetical protein
VEASREEDLDAVAELTRQIETERGDLLRGDAGHLAADDRAAQAEEEHEDTPAIAAKPEPRPKVVPFPSVRPAAQRVEDLEKAEAPAVADDADSPQAPIKAAKPKRASQFPRGKGGRRLQLKPVTVMFGIEPSFSGTDPAKDGQQADPAARNGVCAPAICYPQMTDLGLRVGIPVSRLLFSIEPETSGSAPAMSDVSFDASAPREWRCELPAPLITGRRLGDGPAPAVGSQRAWMFLIDPVLAEMAGGESQSLSDGVPAGGGEPLFPPPLLSRVNLRSSAAKLDLSGLDGSYGPPVLSLCGLEPQACGGDMAPTAEDDAGDQGWFPSAVLGPRFDVEWPTSRDLSDLGQ